MDLQIVLDEYSCAQYVVEYVNKSNRGISDLHRPVLTLYEQNPEQEYSQLLKQVGLKLLNSVEMTAQEAAWYLLRQPMSHSSRLVRYIPTVWPQERLKAVKTHSTINQEKLPADSTSIWKKSIMDKYEERPRELRDICLADFAAWYMPVSTQSNLQLDADECPDIDIPDDLDLINVKRYRRRNIPLVIRYRHYEIEDTLNYQRELVTLFYPYQNELIDILDRHKFLELYKEHQDIINGE